MPGFDLEDCGVEETLLIPLIMRARETARPDAICRDHKAVQIVQQLDGAGAKFERAGQSMQLDIAVRTEIIDEVVSDFLSRHRDALVVNLGAGLDARYTRLDEGSVVWIDLDLPAVISLRRRYFQENLRNPFIACSVFDQDWFDLLFRRRNQPLLLIAEGLLPYLPAEQVWELLARVAQRLPGAELVIQTISPELVHNERLVPAVNQTRATFEWGIESGQEIANRISSYELLGEWFSLDRHTKRWDDALRKWWYVPDIREQVRRTMKLSHLRVRLQPA
jgi:methyltransferase (TIGR00027 family)